MVPFGAVVDKEIYYLEGKDEIFCLFEGALDNLGSLRQQYGLAKSANEVILVIEAYKALRDRAPYPPNHLSEANLLCFGCSHRVEERSFFFDK
ncbi:hypothetical protein LWI29_022592 [Acer saccharum]|uniref:DUF3700 domain-containing protein n=1 Tax=Acer saccharum TaxID=4024 RepID=A0AA39W8P4_ACESA|nr:hypothetical protein LWI29_022592 [Acer saccharum]